MNEKNAYVGFKVQQKLAPYIEPKVTSLVVNDYMAGEWSIYSTGDDFLENLGINLAGEKVTVAIRSTNIPIGRVFIHASQPGSVIIIDNSNWSGAMNASIRIAGKDCLCVFHLAGNGIINLLNVLLRANEQVLFWGQQSTAVECSILEINGPQKAVIVGDDAMISNGVTIRNHDMHALIDTNNFSVTNPPVTTIIEKHVWVGQDVLLLSCRRVGYGSVLGAYSLVKGVIPPKVIASGIPAKVVRENRSWGRDSTSISDDEIKMLTILDSINH